MNYGYVNDGDDFEHLSSTDETYYPEFQKNLYRFLYSHSNLNGKEILEIGCGRGGGCNLIHATYNCKRIVGIDITNTNIQQCKTNFGDTGIEFYKGDAEKIMFSKNSFDVVINLESSHCYGSRTDFFKNVLFILKPKGDFLFADLFWNDGEIAQVEKAFNDIGIKILSKSDIGNNIVKSMELQSKFKEKLIKNSIFSKANMTKNSLATIDSDTYHSLKNGKTKYLLYHLSKD